MGARFCSAVAATSYLATTGCTATTTATATAATAATTATTAAAAAALSADAAKKEKAKISAEVASEREKTLAGLSLMVNVGGDASRQVTVGTLNAEARQNVVVVSGKRQMVQDALLKAQVRRRATVVLL